MKNNASQPFRPVLLDPSHPEDLARKRALEKNGDAAHSIEAYRSQIEELYAIEHPADALKPGFKESAAAYARQLEKETPLETQGMWVFFPWSSTLVHILKDAEFQKVRTARNRNLITEEEQKKFYGATIGVAGLSVGNSVALAIALQGGARHMKLADHDTLDLSNLNRIRAGVQYLGVPKVVLTARQIYELNPYAELELFPDGITESNILSFFEGLTMVVDEMDNLALKLRVREEAKKRRLPVIAAADNDKSGVLDVERYDLDPDTIPFHGALGAISTTELAALDKRGIGSTIAKLIGLENHTERMLNSLQAMGTALVSWPQLGGTALLNGALVAYAALRIANMQPLIEKRAIIAIDKELDADYESIDRRSARSAAIAAFKEILGL